MSDRVVAYYPKPEDVPEWSDATLVALDELTPLERSVVEWYATGCSGAEAYRRARRLEPPDGEYDTARNNAWGILARPRVKIALDACRKDVSFGPRMDREWMLKRLRVALEKAERSTKPSDQDTVARIVKTIAELKGELAQNNRNPNDGDAQRGSVRVRIIEILADADRLAARRTRDVSGEDEGDDGGPTRPALGAD